MDAQLRARAEARLEEAAATLGLADPRPPYRERLRALRETDAAMFDEAIRHYEQTVLPALADGEPLEAWLAYGSFLTRLAGPASLTQVDATGLATPYQPPVTTGALLLYIPENTAEPVLVALEPLQPSAAQQATLELLVARRTG